MPARDEFQPARIKNFLKPRHRGRKFVAFFNAVKADLRGFVQALLKADMRAKAAVVVICPGNRVGAVSDHSILGVSQQGAGCSF